jgi:hypothetical protein
LNENGKVEGFRELTQVFELVKNGEMILHEMSEKIESARFLEEFVVIMDSAALSVNEIKGDLEQMVPAAEAALEEMHDAVSKVSMGLSAEFRQEIEPGILAEVAAVIATGKVNEPIVEIQEAALEPEEKEVEPESVPA